MIIDREELYLLAFNFTYLDMERSRSFGLVTTDKRIVQEAIRLFEADTRRHPFEPSLENFVVSPLNARQELVQFIKDEKKELLVYDPRISDPAMIRLLAERAKDGVEVRIIGRLARTARGLKGNKLPSMRLHTRTMIADGNKMFLGSQSLRAAELDARRELGLIFRDPKAIASVTKTFEADWQTVQKPGAAIEAEEREPVIKVAKKAAKAVTKKLPPVAPVVEEIVKEMVGEEATSQLNPQELEESIKDAVQTAVRDAVRDAVEEYVERSGK
jgi:phosphatidylserine/phosphatidylglycerophosphate/cardiolipin synthase-like enzyme